MSRCPEGPSVVGHNSQLATSECFCVLPRDVCYVTQRMWDTYSSTVGVSDSMDVSHNRLNDEQEFRLWDANQDAPLRAALGLNETLSVQCKRLSTIHIPTNTENDWTIACLQLNQSHLTIWMPPPRHVELLTETLKVYFSKEVSWILRWTTNCCWKTLNVVLLSVDQFSLSQPHAIWCLDLHGLLFLPVFYWIHFASSLKHSDL